MNAAASKHPPREFLQAFGLGKLDDGAATKVSQHLDTCDDCKRQVAELSSDSLLDHLRKANGPVSTPAPGRTLAPLAPAAPPQAATLAPTGVPAELLNNAQYDIMRELGAGGMGVVYLAKNKLMDRLEVLKVISTAMVHKSGALDRFLREIRSAAALSHDNVVKAYSALQFGELLVFAMEYVEGEDLSKVVKTQGPLPIANACFYARQVALGLQHAHEKNMVHRDIKPHNLILARNGKKHLVKILDFGLAKATSEKKMERDLTGEGRMLGTPDYMAPEQIQDAASADIRADIYSLGCTLYYLLTGATPFNANSLYGLLQAHQTQEAKSVNLVRPEVPMELGAIVAKMMAKDPKKRYQKPIDVAQAMAPFIAKAGIKGIAPAPAVSLGEVLQAKPARPDAAPKHVEAFAPIPLATPVPHATMIAANPFSWPPDAEDPKATPKTPEARTPRRFKPMLLAAVAAGAVFLGLLLLVGGIILRVESNEGTLIIKSDDPNAIVKVTAEGGATLTYGRDRREIQLKPGKYGLELADAKSGLKLSATQITLTTGDKKTIEISWEKKLDAPDKIAKDLGPKNPSIQSKQGLPSPSAALEALRRDNIPPEALALAGDGDPKRAPASLVAVLGEAQPIHSQAVLALAYSPNGRWLASGSRDKTIMLHDTTTGNVKRILKGHTEAISAVAFSKDSKSLVSCSHDGTLRLWSVDTEDKSMVVDTKLGQKVFPTMAVSSDRRFVAVGGVSGLIKLWKWGAWEKSIEFPALTGNGTIRALAFSPDGELLACGGEKEANEKERIARVRIYATADGTLKGTIKHSIGAVFALTFSHDGKHLASVGHDGNGRVWEVGSGKEVAQLARDYLGGEWPNSYAVAWSPDDKTLAVGGNFQVVVYDPLTGTKQTIRYDLTTTQGDRPVLAIAFSPDGNMLAAGGQCGDVPVWNTATWKRKYLDRGHRHFVRSVAFNPDGPKLLSLGDESALLQWDLIQPRKPVVRHLDYSKVTPLALVAAAVFCGEDGKTEVIAWHSGIAVWNTVTQQEKVIPSGKGPVGSPHIGYYAVSRDCRNFAAGGNSILRLWDLTLAKEVHCFSIKGGWWPGSAFSHDGGFLATCNDETKQLMIWNVATGNESCSWEIKSGGTASAFHPNGKILATGHQDGSLLLWDTTTAKKIQTLAGHSAPIRLLKFTPDGKTLISSGDDGVIRVWSPENARAREAIPVGPANQPLTFDLDPSGKYLFAAGHCPLIFVVRLPEPSAGEPGKIAGDLPPKSLNPDRTVAVDLGGGVKMEFVLIPKGKFKMGSPKEEKARHGYENSFDAEAQHDVEITKSFYLAKYPVTQEQYEAVTGKNPSCFAATGGGKGQVAGLNTKQFPVEQVSWNDAKACCADLTKKDKQGHLFRLPTEAEWEYACRAGTQTAYFFGDDPQRLGEYAWYRDNARGRPHPVGEKKPNPWGLHDMNGNVWQCCEDYYGPYEGLTTQDPLRKSRFSLDRHVVRGSSWAGDMVPQNCRAACRGSNAPDYPIRYDGFRIALILSDEAAPVPADDLDRKAAADKPPGPDVNQKVTKEAAKIGEKEQTVGGKVFLSDLQESDWKGHKAFMKNGEAHVAGGIRVNDEKSAKGLWMHPPSHDYSSIKYKINGLNAQTLKAKVAINDSAYPKGAASHLTFEVWGDGRVLWSSKPAKLARELQECSVKVEGCQVLELRVVCPGKHDRAHAAWLDPYLVNRKKAIPAPPPLPPANGFIPLFNGKDLTGWAGTNKKPAAWNVFDGDLVVAPGTGNISTTQNFGPNFQLHVEFNVPLEASRKDQGRGNSGIFLLGRHEIQILDSFGNPQAPELSCAALFGQVGPTKNVCKPPNEWQSFDITFRAPRAAGMFQPGELSVVHNGVLVIDKCKVGNPNVDAPFPGVGSIGPIVLRDHGSAVRFRNLTIKTIP